MTNSSGRALRAAIYFYEGFLSVQPSVVGAALALHRRGYDVTIYTAKPTMDVPPPNLPSEIKIREFTPVTRLITKPVIRLLRSLVQRGSENKPGDLVPYDVSRRARLAAKALTDALEIPQFGLYCAFARQADIAIAFDTTGLMAMDFGVRSPKTFVYWALEIRLLSEADNVVARLLKRHEMRRIPRAAAIATQSQERRALLEEDTDLSSSTVVTISNGPSQVAPEAWPKDFFTRQFDIPSGDLVVLHAGMISPATCSLQIAGAASRWPAGFSLVFHERTKRDPEDAYLAAVRSEGQGRVFLSLSPVAFEKVGMVYAGAHIGIVCYETGEANLAKAWASSGKLPFYLCYGLPIVVVADVEPPVIRRWRCGIWVQSIDDISKALETIAGDYAGFSRRAADAFVAEFDFDAGFERLMNAIANAKSRRGALAPLS